MPVQSSGLHHVTAIAGEPQRNLDFYAGTLGLRLVKRTVNFDDPGTYHFYFGDRIGRPGTLLTFFPWAGAPSGRHGVGQATLTAFAVPVGGLEFWAGRLGAASVGVTRVERFGERSLRFADPDGLGLELVERNEPRGETWPESPVPAAYQLSGVTGTTMVHRGNDATAEILTDVLGFVAAGQEGNMRRFVSRDGAAVDLIRDPTAPLGSLGTGTVHHLAWRAADGADQARFRGDLLGRAIGVTPVVDRQYFRSIYFREPGGVLFEIATDGPGFLLDEDEVSLGQQLRLPPQFESRREEITGLLPPLAVPVR